MTTTDEPEVEDLGRMPFVQAHRRMLEVAEAVHAGTAGRILLVEHDAVHTAGRATPPDEMAPGIVPVERGGRVTFHGPGQLVVYPIVRLPRRDVRQWLHALERFGIAVCAEFGLRAEPAPDGNGVFVAGRKVASIGVAIRHWINLHGIAINVDMDLSGFRQIRPCGLDPEVMTDLSRAAGRQITLAEAKAAARARLFVLLRSAPTC